MGKKILVPCLDVLMIAFFSLGLVLEIWSLYISLGKGDHYYIQTRHKDLFSTDNLILRKLYEKMYRKALENTNEICSCPPGHSIRLLKSN